MSHTVFAGVSPQLMGTTPPLIRTQSPDVGQKGKGVARPGRAGKVGVSAKLRDSGNAIGTSCDPSTIVRSQTPKSHQVRLSCEETSPARSLSRGSSTSSRARSLDYSKNNTTRPGTARFTRPVVRSCCFQQHPETYLYFLMLVP
jgi:hypothetical protein